MVDLGTKYRFSWFPDPDAKSKARGSSETLATGHRGVRRSQTAENWKLPRAYGWHARVSIQENIEVCPAGAGDPRALLGVRRL